MSLGQQALQQSSSTWTEPPWSGWIETTGDALLILEAARRGLIPRVTRRLVDSERKMITSGSVFVFDEDESGIKRWTDGFFWSPSRILGNFLLYRETDKRSASHRNARAESELNDGITYTDGTRIDGQQLSRPRSDGMGGGVDKQRERTLLGSLTNSYKFKPDGLMKKTFSVTIGGVAQHLISYYKVEDVENGRLRSPSSLPELASLDISPEYLDKTHFRNPPKVEIGVDGIPRYRGEADDIDTSAGLLSGPLSSGPPLLSNQRAAEMSTKRMHRFDPYGTQPVAKRPRRDTKASQSDEGSTSTAEPMSPQASGSSSTSQPVPPTPAQTVSAPAIYPEPNLSHPIAGQPPAPPPGPYPTYGLPPFYPVQGYSAHPPPPPGLYAAPPPPHQVGVPYPPPPAAAGAPNPGSPPSIPPQPGMPYPPYPGFIHHPPPQAPTPAQQQQQQQQPSAPQVHGSDSSQAGHVAPQPPHTQHPPPPQPYYPFYPHPPPPHGYAPYPGQWPVYSGYPPPPHPVQHPSLPHLAPVAQAVNPPKAETPPSSHGVSQGQAGAGAGAGGGS